MHVREKGRFVLEAAYLVPGICILLVFLVYFTLYAHDYAVCTHAALESGTKGIYQSDRTATQEQTAIKTDLEKKLDERLLWIDDPEVVVSVSPLRASICIVGSGRFLTTYSIEVNRTLYRVNPCDTLRTTRWLMNTAGEEG
ncbi:MAG: hypothetical protein LUC98_14665 [Lachnospiraceae bacterium]|nr:hypothetical protein [Lachnospiraceae bacterium]